MADYNFSGKNSTLYLLQRIKAKFVELTNGFTTSLNTKVDKETGKGLSTNDFTDELKTKLLNAEDSTFNGSYSALTNKPTLNGTEISGDMTIDIPTNVSELINDSEYQTSANVVSAINTATSGMATQTYVNSQISALVDGAPETLDTLKELATALGDTDDVIDGLMTTIGQKVDTSSIVEITNDEIDTLWNTIFTS